MFEGEDLEATLAGDERGNVFTTLGYDSVAVFRDGRIDELESSNQVPRGLFVHNGKVISLNRDSSISVWDIPSRDLVLNLHMFRDGTWAAELPGGGYRFNRAEDLF